MISSDSGVWNSPHLHGKRRNIKIASQFYLVLAIDSYTKVCFVGDLLPKRVQTNFKP